MFRKLVTSLVLGTTLIASGAQAHDGRRWNNPYRDHNSGTGTAVAAGAIGLILGLAIGSSHRDEPRYVERERPDDTDYLRSRNEEDYLRSGYYYYQGYYYGPRGYYYRDRYYDDQGYGYRYYWHRR